MGKRGPATRKVTSKTKTVSIAVDTEFKKELMELAADTGKTVSSTLRPILEKELASKRETEAKHDTIKKPGQ
jgi:predicted DNA-binding protein